MNIPSDCIKTVYESYFLVKYPPSKKHDPAYSKFRSVIFKTDGTMVCYSPPKSVPQLTYEEETDDVPELDESKVVFEEFVEGTMINAFYDEGWKIATKSVLGAECTFNSSRTFASMFEDFHFDFTTLNPLYCYSFVMQHPENQIILKTGLALWLVAVYEIIDNVPHEREIPFLKPKQYACTSYGDAQRITQETLCKGMVLKCKGQRSKLWNQEYIKRSIHKGTDTFEYHYLKIRNTPLLDTYLYYFPWDLELSKTYEERIRKCTKLLLDDYVSCFIHKKAMLKTYVRKNYLYELHQIYLTELRCQKRKMYRTRVVAYLNSLQPARLLTLLRM
jgi:hypothetical protein